MELDYFAWITKNCEPIAAHEAELANCSFARESEDFEELSPSPTPITPIGMISVPRTPNSADQIAEVEDAVFHTPPEESPLEEQSPNHLKVTISEAKRARVVAGEEFDGDTVSSSEAEVVGRLRVVSDEDLEIAAWLEEWCAANKAAAAAVKQKIGGFMNNGVDIENVDGVSGEKPNEASEIAIVECKSSEIESGGFEKGLAISKSAEKTGKGSRNGGVSEKIDGGKCKLSPSKDAGDSCGFEKGVEMAKTLEESAKDGHGNDGKRIKKIDGRKHKFSPLSKGKEKVTWGSSQAVGYKSYETESGELEKGVESAKSAEKSTKDGNGNGGVNNKGRTTQKIDAGKQKLSPFSNLKEKKVTWGSCKICEAEADVIEKGVEMAKSAERNAKDGHGNRGVNDNKGIRIEKTDDRKRKLPPSCTGKEKDAGENSNKQKIAAKDGHGNGVNNKGIRIEKTDGRKRKLPPSCTGKEKNFTWSSCKICEAEAGELEKGVEMAKSAERNAKDGHGNIGVNNEGIRIEKTDGVKQKLPPSCTGKENDAGESSKKQKSVAKDGHGNREVNNNTGIRIEKADGRKRKLSPSGNEKDTEQNSKKQKTAAKDSHGNGGVNNKGVRIEETDGRKRKLPPSCTGKEKDPGENAEKRSGSPPLMNEKGEGGSSRKKNGVSEFSEFLILLMKHFEYKRNGDEDDILIEMKTS